MLSAEELVVQEAVCAYRALWLYQHAKIDYADALTAMGAALAGCSRTATLDRAAIAGEGMELLA